MKITKLEIAELLKEDKVLQDITTNAVIVQNKMQDFEVISKNKTPIILCGVDAIVQGLEATTSKYATDFTKQDGDIIQEREVIFKGRASIKELLQIERTVLNLIQHLSGIATKTRIFVETLDNDKIKVMDTRKTMPYLRKLQKYAVTVGGGFNHRMDLSEMILIKDNHIAVVGSIKEAIRLAVKHRGDLKVEVECDNLTQVEEAINYPIDVILLDNMSVQEVNVASGVIRKHSNIKIEVSGGINLSNIANYRNIDVDYISIGDLTHSVNAVDISMEILPEILSVT